MYATHVAGCMSQYDVVQEISYMPGLDSNVEVVARQTGEDIEIHNCHLGQALASPTMWDQQ